jgi:hypothetical protein
MKTFIYIILMACITTTSVSQLTTNVTAQVKDTNNSLYVNCQWSVVFVGENATPGAGPYQPDALLQGQQGHCDSQGNFSVSLADNINTITPTPSQWQFAICSAPGYPQGPFCKTNILITITGATQDITSVLTPLMPLLSSTNAGSTIAFPGIPTGTCTAAQTAVNQSTGDLYSCVGGSWLKVGPITNASFLLGNTWAAPGPIGGTTPDQVTTTQVNLAGTGGASIIGAGGTLPTPGAATGGIGIATGAIPQINPNNVGWFAIPYITVNGTALANTANNTDLSNTTPAAPTNGLNLQFQFSGQHISAAIVGDGNAAHALCGNGAFGVCTAGGATALSGLTAATGANTIANGSFGQIWQWALTGASAVGITDTESAAATGGTPLSQAVRQVSTVAGSTAVPLIVSDSLTGSQTLPAGYINCAWNTTGIVDACLLINAVNTASGTGSFLFDAQLSGVSKASIDKAGNVAISGSATFGGNSGTANISTCGGSASLCGSNTNGTTGGLTSQGGDNSSAGSSVKAGYLILRGGFATAATPNAAALEGTTQLGAGYLKGSAIATIGDIVCGTTTAFTVTDCSHTGPAVNIIGIATNTANPIGVVSYGTALVKTDGAVTIGDILCMGTTTDGQAHDNGTSACATAGTTIGVVIATSGSITQMSGNSTASTAMSTMLPLVQLHIGK